MQKEFEGTVKHMQNGPEAQMRKELSAEIQALQQHYQKIQDYLAGKQMASTEITVTLRAFKDTLSVASAHILTIYQLKGQRAKITWDSLFTNLDTALENIRNAAHPNPRAAIQTALNMSSPKIDEVMKYLTDLKQTL